MQQCMAARDLVSVTVFARACKNVGMVLLEHIKILLLYFAVCEKI